MASAARHPPGARDLAMFNLAIDNKLRGCDLVRLRVGDVVLGGAVRLRTAIVQQKTGRPVPFELTDSAREALTAWLRKRGPREEGWLFPSRSRPGDHITTRQYGRLLEAWVALIGLDPALYATHSLRRTKVALIYKRTGRAYERNATSRSNRRTGKPIRATAPSSACFRSRPVLAEGIMASGHARRTNRSNTWPHRPALQNAQKPLPTESRPHMAPNGTSPPAQAEGVSDILPYDLGHG
jgi:hypothetical protein